MSLFPFSTTLAGLSESSERRFQLNILAQQQRDADGLIAELKGVIDWEISEQERILDAQQVVTDALAQSFDLLTKAVDDGNEFAKKQSDTNRYEQERINDTLKRIADAMEAAQRELDVVYQWWQGLSSGASAGGLVGRRGGVTGFPHATGDIKLSLNITMPGWLYCHGQQVRKDEYPELYERIGTAFGTFVYADTFRIPRKDELTADAVILANPKLRYFIRT